MNVVFVGDDWAEGHHDVHLSDESGKTLFRGRLDEGIEGIARLHALIGEHLDPQDLDPTNGWLRPGAVVVGIETERGVWVQNLIAAGYRVIAINPRQVARYRERYATSGAKSDKADAAILARIVRQDGDLHREVAADTELAESIKLTARAHQQLIQDRVQHGLRLRSTLREYHFAALAALEAVGLELTDPDALELLMVASTPAAGRELSTAAIEKILRSGRRRHAAAKADQVAQVLREPRLEQSEVIAAAFAAIVVGQARVLLELIVQIKALQEVVAKDFGRHRAAEIYLSQPGLGQVAGARMLGEFGDAAGRYRSARARKNFAGSSPVTIASGGARSVKARTARNRRMASITYQQAFSALSASPGARAYYDALRARGKGHNAALRQLSNRLVGILHGCLAHECPYDEATAWPEFVCGSSVVDGGQVTDSEGAA